jgi:hypothetical protein
MACLNRGHDRLSVLLSSAWPEREINGYAGGALSEGFVMSGGRPLIKGYFGVARVA